MADESIIITETTRHKYMKGASDLTMRKRLLLAMLKRRGRIEFDQSGDECAWDVEFSEPPVSAHGDGGVIDFSNHDAYRQIRVDWRGYVATDTMTKKQQRMNRGDEAIVKVFQNKSNKLTKSIRNNFCGELYRDGGAAGRENNIHGLETFMADDGNTVVGDRIANPSDTYGETALSTALGNIAGSWTSAGTAPNATLATDWPNGSGDSEYDYLSPKLINWASTSWTGTNTWEANAWRVISQAITWLTVTGGDDGMPNLIPLSSNLYQGYKDAQEVKTRINVPFKEGQDLGLRGPSLQEDGVGIYPDFDCPIDTGYVMSLNEMTVSSLFPELFWMEGPDKDPRTAWSWLWGVGFYGNVKYQPKYFAKLFNYAAS